MNFHFRHLLVPFVEIKPDMKEIERQAALERKMLESEMLHMLACRARLLDSMTEQMKFPYFYKNLN